MITFANVLPKQTTPIPWGWENTSVDGGPWKQATYVSRHVDVINMPKLVDFFDWQTFVVEGSPQALGTRNMKSVFTTAARFLGYERLLTEQPSLSVIADGFLAWNHKLLHAWIGLLSYYMLGDDVAGNMGLFMSPALWRRWIWPRQQELLAQAKMHGLVTIWHSDGDIAEVLPDLLASPLVDVINYESVGKMQAYAGRKHSAANAWSWCTIRGRRTRRA